MAPFWKMLLLDMSLGLPGRPRAGRRSPMNMHEHLECYDESLIGPVLLIMFVLIAAVLAVILQPSESSSGKLPILRQ